MQEQKISLGELFLTFFKIGITTFGGGYAMLPIIERELIDKKKWMTQQDLMDYFALSQVTPGVIAVNTASLLGYQKRGALGSIAATLGVIAPSIIIITLIALFLKQYMSEHITERLFTAIRICVGALIINALIPIFKKGIINIFTFALFAISLIIYFVFRVSPVLLVILCACAALIEAYIKFRKEAQRK